MFPAGAGMTHIVDLATTVISQDHKVWKLFPGEAYKFVTLMSDEKLVFLDVRGLTKLGDFPEKWDDEKLVEAVSVDRWKRQNSARDEVTERRVTAVDKANATYVKGILVLAKAGDLVVVPQQGPAGLILIGQFTEESGKSHTLEAQDGRVHSTYVGRRVRWLGKVNKRKVPLDVVERLQTPVSFFDMGDTGRTLFYKLAFGSFSYDGFNYAEFETTKQVFTSRDSRNASTWFELVELLEASLRSPTLVNQIKSASLRDLIDDFEIDEIDRADLSININSPGTIILQAVANTPLIALAIYPLAVASVPYAEAKQITVQVQTAGRSSTECEGAVSASVKQILNNLGARKWTEACEIAKRASTQTTLETKSHLKVKRKSANRPS